MPKYDVAIVGAGIAGLCTAALLATAGKKIFLADPSDRAGGAVMPVAGDGMLLAPGPDITYGLEKCGDIQSLYAALGIAGDGPGRPAPYQVALPDRRVTIAPRNEDTLEELRREFPGEIDTIVRLYRDSKKISLGIASSRLTSYVAGKRTAFSFLQRYRLSPELTSFFDVQSRYFFRRPVSELSLRTLTLMMHTPPEQLQGGFCRLATLLYDRIRDRGADVNLNEPWPEMLFRGRRLTGIRTTKGTIEARSFVVNASWPGDAYTMVFGVHDDILPVRMENTVICLHEYTGPRSWGWLSITPGPSDPPAAESLRTLTASFCTGGAADLSREALLARIDATIPFFSDLVVTGPDRIPGERSFALPENTLVKKNGGSSDLPQLPFPSTARNLILLPDSSCGLLEAVRTAQTIASKIK